MSLKEIQKIVGSRWVAVDPANRLFYSRDSMTGAILERKSGILPHLPDLICWPKNRAEISKILRLASKKRIPVIAYGAGSGVSGGTIPIRGGIILDLKRMNHVGSIREEGIGYSVTAETGIIGEHLERILNQKGFTLGHFPSSILCATLGGYLACRSAGQLSSKYGKIEDRVEEVETVLANGQVIPFGRKGKVASPLPKIRLRDLFVGSEGCLGIITKARLRVSPLPPVTRYRGVSFNRLQDGLKAIREIMQSGLRPAVVRLYDPLDTLLLRHGYEESKGFPFLGEAVKDKIHDLIIRNPQWLERLLPFLVSSEVILIMAFEGEPQFAEIQEKKALSICQRSIARDLGEKPGLHWLKHRYSVSFKMPELLAKGYLVDTIEVATTWSRLFPLYQKIRKILTRKVLLLAHFSHVWQEGCSIYFTVIGKGGDNRSSDRTSLVRLATGKAGSLGSNGGENPDSPPPCPPIGVTSPQNAEKLPSENLQIYQQVWDESMEACLSSGATISHHHGIGLLKAKYLPRELGEAMEFYRTIKKRLDPRVMMNPGKMGL